jgi:hypothetical protein
MAERTDDQGTALPPFMVRELMSAAGVRRERRRFPVGVSPNRQTAPTAPTKWPLAVLLMFVFAYGTRQKMIMPYSTVSSPTPFLSGS